MDYQGVFEKYVVGKSSAIILFPRANKGNVFLRVKDYYGVKLDYDVRYSKMRKVFMLLISVVPEGVSISDVVESIRLSGKFVVVSSSVYGVNLFYVLESLSGISGNIVLLDSGLSEYNDYVEELFKGVKVLSSGYDFYNLLLSEFAGMYYLIVDEKYLFPLNYRDFYIDTVPQIGFLSTASENNSTVFDKAFFLNSCSESPLFKVGVYPKFSSRPFTGVLGIGFKGNSSAVLWYNEDKIVNSMFNVNLVKTLYKGRVFNGFYPHLKKVYNSSYGLGSGDLRVFLSLKFDVDCSLFKRVLGDVGVATHYEGGDRVKLNVDFVADVHRVGDVVLYIFTSG